MSSVKEILNRKPTLRAASLLSLPLLWLGVIYIGSLFALFITSIWKIDTFTSKIIREFTLENFIDVFTRDIYRFIIIDSLKYCIENKDLELYAWVIMTNHVHLIIGTRGEPMENILRDLKKHTSKKIVAAIADNPEESRKEWMIWMFERAGKKNPNNTNVQFFEYQSLITKEMQYGVTNHSN